MTEDTFDPATDGDTPSPLEELQAALKADGLWKEPTEVRLVQSAYLGRLSKVPEEDKKYRVSWYEDGSILVEPARLFPEAEVKALEEAERERFRKRIIEQGMRDHPFEGDGIHCKHFPKPGSECGYLREYHPEAS